MILRFSSTNQKHSDDSKLTLGTNDVVNVCLWLGVYFDQFTSHLECVPISHMHIIFPGKDC